MTWSRAPPPEANAGRSFATRSARRSFPSSIRIMTLVAVASGFVSEAMSKTVSAVIASTAGTIARFPYALRKTTFPRRPTRTTAPGHSFLAIDSSMTASIRARRSADIPAAAGEAAGRGARAAARTETTAARRRPLKLFTPRV